MATNEVRKVAVLMVTQQLINMLENDICRQNGIEPFEGWCADGEVFLPTDENGAPVEEAIETESVMMDAFEKIAPHLEDGSEIKIYPDNGLDHGIIENGNVKWLMLK